MDNPTVLVVDDEQLIRWSLTERLAQEGYRLLEAGTAADAIARHREGVDLVLLDYRLPDGDGLAVLKQMKEVDPDTLVILLTGHASVGTAVEAMKHGAYHYTNKPFDLEEIVLLVERALETTRLRREVKALRATQAQPYGVARFVGESDAMVAIRALLQKVAASPASTVLLTGESGTGKDLAAKVIHYASNRAAKPFMNITCSALPEALLESELFGHERGAFTGADRQKRGLLESTDGGTVFLDEIGEMVPGLQAKLLRFLEEKTFKRVGGSVDIRVDVRVIAATNRTLEDEVRQGRFREDLYYRLNVLPIPLPPLRERAKDIPALVNYYVDAYNREFKKRVKGVTKEAMSRLQGYRWPGNVRELRNAVERAMLLVEGSELTPAEFPVASGASSPLTEGVPTAERGHRPGAAGTVPRRPGARAQRLEPDARRRAARHQPRSDPVSHRKVQTGTAHHLMPVSRLFLEALVLAALLGCVSWLLARDRRRQREGIDALRRSKQDLELRMGAHEAALRDSNARLQSVIDSAVDGIIIIDAEGRIESFNRGAERLFGYSGSQVIGRNVSMLMPSPYHEEHDGYIAAYLTSGKAKIIGTGREVAGLHRDGSTFPIHLSVGEMIVGGERKFTGIIHDLAARVRMEEQPARKDRIGETW